MSFTVVFHRLAVRDYLEGRRWYAQRSQLAALGFQRSLEQAIDRIRDAPQFGTPCEHDCLWIKLKKYPYLLRYRIELESEIVVYAVAHKRRRKGYWMKRV